MSGESQLWTYLRDGLRGRWHAQRHEDRISAGVPDVSYAIDGVDGWIELKSLKAWPVRAATPVRIGLTQEQASWLRARGRTGAGRVFVLLRVDRDHLLFSWRAALDLSDPCSQTHREVVRTSVASWSSGRIDFPELADWLSGRKRWNG